MIGSLDHVEIVFDYQQRAARVDQRAKRREQFVDVVEVQTGGRLVEDVERFRAGSLEQVRREFDALCLTAGKRCRRLAQTQITQARRRPARAIGS